MYRNACLHVVLLKFLFYPYHARVRGESVAWVNVLARLRKLKGPADLLT